jgi:EmrB/QacA subfamily drug resistance transporter
LAAAVLGFFVVTLDAVVVNVALPSVRNDLGGGIAGLQWVVDGYTLMFAALLLSAGALSDRLGARKLFAVGLVAFTTASLACGLAPNLGALVVARFVQGSAAAAMMPSSMALISHAYPVAKERARAVAVWAVGGSIAASSGPLIGGVLTLIDWRLIFLINLPVGIVALVIVRNLGTSHHHQAPFDWAGQLTGIVAMGGLTYAAIEAGSAGLFAPRVLIASALAIVAAAAFVIAQLRGSRPMVPPALFKSRNVTISMTTGFAFMVGYYGLPFVFSLYLQQLRSLTALQTGLVFLPMMLIGTLITPVSAHVVERVGAKAVIATGLLSMMVGLTVLALLPSTTGLWVLAIVMMLVGVAGPLVAPPITAVLLNSVPHGQAGTASGVFNTSRQVGGALAIAVFGALLAKGDFMAGLRTSLLIAAAVALLTALTSLLLEPVHGHTDGWPADA